MNSLIHYTNENKSELVSENEGVSKNFISLISEINPNLTKQDILLTKMCIEKYKITRKELADAVLGAYADPERMGKMEFKHVWDHIRSKREQMRF